MLNVETTGCNATNHLDSDAAILGYLEAVIEDSNPALIATALSDVAKARGIAEPPKRRLTSHSTRSSESSRLSASN